MQALKNYKKQIIELQNQSVNLSESSFRTIFENLLNAFLLETKAEVKIFQEIAKKESKKLIIPDFTCISAINLGTIGFVETKDYGFDIENYTQSEQIQKYRAICDNILLSNYSQFIWLHQGFVQTANISQETELLSLLNNFFAQSPQQIHDPHDLATKLAFFSRKLKTDLAIELENGKKNHSILYGVYKVFQKSLVNLSFVNFADTFAQMTAFGLMIAKLNNPDLTITLLNVRKAIPISFGLIKELLKYLDDVIDRKNASELYVSQLLGLMNNMNVGKIEDELFTRKQQIVNLYGKPHTQYIDPFVYFYEDYLGEYDPKLRKAKGVYYTPMPIVQLIIRLIDKTLQENFGISKGIADKNVNALDFACGTGTFMVEYVAQALEKQSKGLQKAVIQQRLLPNLSGFEYLAAPYTVAILKMSQFLKRNYGYLLQENDKINIKLTNTLDEIKGEENLLFPNFTQEAADADRIKNEEVLVIMGNPPYSINSENKGSFILNLLKDYKNEQKELQKDKSFNALSDDYVKFIRFAHQKISKQSKGVLGIISNNSFVDGIVHKTMRKKLLADFDKIYIINLHGNAIKKEGDQNVFDIRVGVCISIFIKLEKRLPLDKKELYYYSSLENQWISREQKFDFTEKAYENLANKTLNEGINWQKLSPQAPHFFFVPKDLSQQKEFDTFWSIRNIFEKWNSGLKTHRDKLVIDKDKKALQKRIKAFYEHDQQIISTYKLENTGTWDIEKAIKLGKFDEKQTCEINYRVFDRRFIQFDKFLVERGRTETMQQFLLGKNIGLLTIRKSRSSQAWKHAFVTDTLVSEGTTLGTIDNCYVFPLFRYEKNIENYVKTENFSKDFRHFIDTKYGSQIMPEQVFGYIYAVLYSSDYRQKYNELLRIDFPRIPFVDNLQDFENQAVTGWKLAQMHLLNQIPDSEIADFVGEDLAVSKVFWQNEKLYINATSYFDKVSKAVFDYEIGSYAVLQKYLKERKSELLTLNEIEHLQNVIKVLAKTVDFSNL